MTSNEILDEFGQAYLEKVRDKSIEAIATILTGRSKTYQGITETYSEDVLQGAQSLAPFLIDMVIAQTLGFFEEQERIKISMPDAPDLARVSDGLEGELYGEAGWITRFSKHKATTVGS